MTPQEQRRNCRVQLGGEGTVVWKAKRRLGTGSHREDSDWVICCDSCRYSWN